MEILQLLIAHGAELDIGDENELTSLLIAAQKGIVDILVFFAFYHQARFQF